MQCMLGGGNNNPTIPPFLMIMMMMMMMMMNFFSLDLSDTPVGTGTLFVQDPRDDRKLVW